LSKPKNLSVEQLALRFSVFIDQSAYARKTKQYYKNGLRLLEASSIWGNDLKDLTNELETTLKLPGGPSNKNCALKTLRRMLTLACKWKLAEQRVRIKPLRENMRSRQISASEEEALFERADPDMKLILRLLLDTGARPDEVVALRWEDVDLGQEVLHIPGGEDSKRTRSLKLTTRLVKMLELRRTSAAGWVFLSRSSDGGHLLSSTITVRFIQMKKALGMANEVTLFSARHTFARRFRENGHSRQDLRLALGLSKLKFTDRYEPSHGENN